MGERCIFILGASSDTGMSFIEKKGGEYSLIYAHYNRGNERFDALKESLGEKIVPLKADLSDRSEVQSLLAAVEEKGIYPDQYLHIASDRMTGGKFHKRETDDFDRGWQISVMPAVILLNVFTEKMIRKKYGRIVFMLTSCTLGQPPKYQSAYVTTKYALLGLMKALSAEYASKGITVNGISPEMMDTKFLDGILKKEVVLQESAERNPLKRNIRTEDVIPMMEYLLSDAAEAVTGQNIAITGGAGY